MPAPSLGMRKHGNVEETLPCFCLRARQIEIHPPVDENGKVYFPPLFSAWGSNTSNQRGTKRSVADRQKE